LATQRRGISVVEEQNGEDCDHAARAPAAIVVRASRPQDTVVYRWLFSRAGDLSFRPGLLGRRDALASRRPSVARSAWSNGGDWKGGDHAARAPAAY